MSPLISVPAAICLSRRRMILPERVLGSASAKPDVVGFGDGTAHSSSSEVWTMALWNL